MDHATDDAGAMLNDPWREAVDAFALYLRASSRPETTVRLRAQHLHQLAQVHPDPWGVTADDLTEWMSAHGWAPNTAHSVRSSLRVFYAWARKSGRIAVDPALDLPTVRRPDPNPHPLPEDALRRVLERATERERLILLLAVSCGLRRAEIAALHHDDLIGRPGAWSLAILGKGRKRRTVPIDDDLAEAIRVRSRGYIFPGRVDGHLSPDWVGVMIARMLPEGWTLHAGRHRYATDLMDEERDITVVQRALGHSSPETTLRYVAMPDDAARGAVNRLAARRRAMLAAS